MTKNCRDNIQVMSAIGMLVAGFVLAVAGFVVPPLGEIHDSVLGIFAECLIYSGSIFGVTIYIQSKYSEIRSYVEQKVDEKDRKREEGKVKSEE